MYETRNETNRRPITRGEGRFKRPTFRLSGGVADPGEFIILRLNRSYGVRASCALPGGQHAVSEVSWLVTPGRECERLRR